MRLLIEVIEFASFESIYFWNYSIFVRCENCERFCFTFNLSPFASRFNTQAFGHCVNAVRARRGIYTGASILQFLSTIFYLIIFLGYCSHNYNFLMFRDFPECSGMFRSVPCPSFYRRPIAGCPKHEIEIRNKPRPGSGLPVSSLIAAAFPT